MGLSQRVGRHLRGNVIAYFALFVALSGTAIALPGKNSVKSNDIAPAAVKAKALKAGAVTNSKLAGGAVTSTKVADGSIVGGDLANSAVTQAKLANDAVTRDKILAGTINGGKLANGSVNSAKVNDGSLLVEDFAPNQLSTGFAAEQVSATFNLPRGGPLFVTATFISACPVASCTYVVEVDNTPVTGTALAGDLDQQVILTGVSGAVAAGNRTVEIEVTGATVTEPTIAAVLLQ